MRYIGVDLGTVSGIAYVDGPYCSEIQVGEIDTRKAKATGQRWDVFYRAMAEVLEEQPSCQLWYEHVPRHMGTRAAHVYGGYLSMLELAIFKCAPHTQIGGVTPTALKKFATGKGTASKDEMVAAALRDVSGWSGEGLTHNEADAIWVLQYGLDKLPDDS